MQQQHQQPQQPAVDLPARDAASQPGVSAALQAALNSQGNNNHAVLMLAVKELLPPEERGPARVALAGAHSLTHLTQLQSHISHTLRSHPPHTLLSHISHFALTGAISLKDILELRVPLLASLLQDGDVDLARDLLRSIVRLAKADSPQI
jgi:hypothetical protein